MLRIMWRVGVEGDKYQPHVEQPACADCECVPMTDAELEAFKVSDPFKWQVLKNLVSIGPAT